MKKIYFLFFVFFSVVSIVKAQTIRVEKASEFLKIMNENPEFLQGKTIQLKKGIYHFYKDSIFTKKEVFISNHDHQNERTIAFFLEKLKNVTIDGQGSEFIFHGTLIPFYITHCEKLHLKNFSIDFENPHLRQLTILQVNPQENTSIAIIEPKGNYSVENGKLFLIGTDYKITPEWVMAFSPNKRLTYRRADVDFSVENVTEMAPNTFKITGWSQHQFTKKGERFVLRSYNRPAPAMVLNESLNTSFSNISIHYAWGMGLIAQGSENIFLNKFSVRLKKNDFRYFTTQADATHFSGCKGIIISENGLYEAMADDAINVHGTYLKVIRQLSENSIEAHYMHPQSFGFFWGEKGDEIQFVKSQTMEADAKIYTLKNIEPIDTPTLKGAKKIKLTFSEKIEAINFEEAYGVENLTWTPKVIFRKNIVRNNRARGALFSTPKSVICEKNVFDHTHGTAILLCGDCNGWYETGACTNVIIRKNKFINALTANYQFTNAVISIYPEIPNLEKQQKEFHSGISITNNIFETFDEPILYAKSVNGLLFQKNKIRKNSNFPKFHWNKNRFLIEKSKNIRIQE